MAVGCLFMSLLLVFFSSLARQCFIPSSPGSKYIQPVNQTWQPAGLWLSDGVCFGSSELLACFPSSSVYSNSDINIRLANTHPGRDTDEGSSEAAVEDERASPSVPLVVEQGGDKGRRPMAGFKLCSLSMRRGRVFLNRVFFFFFLSCMRRENEEESLLEVKCCWAPPGRVRLVPMGTFLQEPLGGICLWDAIAVAENLGESCSLEKPVVPRPT